MSSATPARLLLLILAGASTFPIAAASVNPIDRSLPLIAAVLAITALVAGASGVARWHAAGNVIPFAIPLLLAVAVGVPETPVRLLSYGAIVSASLLTALFLHTRDREIVLRYAVVILLCGIALMKAVPFRMETLPQLTAIAAGALVLLRALSFRPMFEEEDEARATLVSVTAVALSFGLAVVTPLEPWRPSLALLALGFTVAFLRTRRLMLAVLALIAAATVGRWALLSFGAAVGAGILFEGLPARTGSALLAVPALRLSTAAAQIRAVLFAPGVVLSAWRSGPAHAVAGLALLVASAFGRPFVASFLALASLALLIDPRHREAGKALAPVPGFFALAALALFPWSGAMAAAFPLPVPMAAAAVLVLMIFCADLFSREAFTYAAGIAGALGFLALGFGMTGAGHQRHPVDTSLAPGEAMVLVPPLRTAELEVVISGAHLSQLAPGTEVATLEAIDDRGRGSRRSIRLGEIADWSAHRDPHRYGAHNSIAARSSWRLADFGNQSYLHGEGRIAVALERPIGRVRVTASPELPAESRISIERMEIRGR